MTSFSVTVVTALYPIRSKFNFSQYIEWVNNFLQMRAPIVLFTEPDIVPLFEALRPSDLPMQIIPIQITNMDTWQFYRQQWIAEHAKDHEKTYHFPELYALWAQKAWFVKRAIEKNPFQTDFFFWCDAGAFRQGPPHPLFPQAMHLPTDKILLNSVEPLTTEDKEKGTEQDFRFVNRIVGGLWGGGKEGCLRWQQAFQNMLEIYFKNGRFAGKDQSVMLSTYLADPTLATVVRCTRPEKDHWFFLQDLLSGQASYEEDASYKVCISSPKPIVSVSIKGGLGNQMFQIATAYAYAERAGAQLRLLKDKPVPDSRPQQYWDTVLAAWKSYLVDTLPPLPRIFERAPTQWMALEAPISMPGVYLEGYWQSAKFFAGAEHIIREKLSATPEMFEAVQKKWGWLLAAKNRIILVHARRTDYLAAAAFHGPLTSAYYKAATEKMLLTVSDPIFLLVSDDPSFWSQIASDIPAFQKHTTIQLQGATDVETLTLLQQLQYFIIANSTFSWWAAWLAGPTAHVIAPAQWFGPTGPKPHEYEDIYEPYWIRI